MRQSWPNERGASIRKKKPASVWKGGRRCRDTRSPLVSFPNPGGV